MQNTTTALLAQINSDARLSGRVGLNSPGAVAPVLATPAVIATPVVAKAAGAVVGAGAVTGAAYGAYRAVAR